MRIFLSSATRAAPFQLYSSRRGISLTGVRFNHSSDKKRNEKRLMVITENSTFYRSYYSMREIKQFSRDIDEDFFWKISIKEFQLENCSTNNFRWLRLEEGSSNWWNCELNNKSLNDRSHESFIKRTIYLRHWYMASRTNRLDDAWNSVDLSKKMTDIKSLIVSF